MRINQKPLIGGGGGNDFTTFSDDFQRVGLGANWAVGLHDVGQASQFQPTISVNNQLNMANGTGASISANVRVQPLTLGGLIGKNQFAECRLVAGAALVISMGPAVACFLDPTQAGVNGYYMGIGNGTITINRVASGALITATFGVPVNNDLFRLAIVFGTTSNTLFSFRNNVLINTTVDAATPSPSGLPAMYCGAASAGVTGSFRAFRAGPGLGG